MLNSIVPMTSQSVNSPAIVRHKINQEYRIHWFLGLRQAELFIIDRTNAINHTESQLKLLSVKRRKLELEIKTLEDRSSELDILNIKEKELEIEQLNNEVCKIHYQVRDALAELEAAQKIYTIIVNEHNEELSNLTFDELQKSFGIECIEAKQANSLCIQMMATQLGQPIAEIIHSLDIDRGPAILRSVAEAYKAISGFSNLVNQSIPGDSNDDI